jgi:hypothetical protein
MPDDLADETDPYARTADGTTVVWRGLRALFHASAHAALSLPKRRPAGG